MDLTRGQWQVDPLTGIISITKQALRNLMNPDPIEKWYIIDPEPIARGQFAVVYHCHHRITGEEFAAKFSSRRRLGVECTADIEHEIAICTMLRKTPRVVRLRDVFSARDEVILVMEFAPGGDLQTMLDEDLVPYEQNAISFLKQLLEGLAFIHDRSIVHLDIKPQNLVLMGDFPDYSVKLCDFEISRMLTPGRELSQLLGTADYVAPEIIHYEPITTKTDMWSFGVLSYVLLTGFLPFAGNTDQETFLEITKADLDFPKELFEDISEHAIDFIKRLLIRQPHLRMSARESLKHPWMKSGSENPEIHIETANLDYPFNSTSNSSMQSIKSRSFTVPSMATSSHDIELSNIRINDMELASRKCASPTAIPSTTASNSVKRYSSSPRETGLPPFCPHISSRASQSTHSSTCSLNRGGSRQSLERLRSMSKSREVLFERLQMSSQRKVLSRSRERIYDGRYGLYKPSNQLSNHQSISQSVEALSPFTLLYNDNTVSFSNSNVFTSNLTEKPHVAPEGKNDDTNSFSIATVNHLSRQIENKSSVHKPNVVSENKSKQKNTERRQEQNLAYCNKDLSTKPSTKSNRYSKKDVREPQKSPSSPAILQADRQKRKTQMQKCIKSPKQENYQNITKRPESPNLARSTDGRKGSGSHIEQRIQLRRERREKNSTVEKPNSKQTRSKMNKSTVETTKNRKKQKNSISAKLKKETNKQNYSKSSPEIVSSSDTSHSSSLQNTKDASSTCFTDSEVLRQIINMNLGSDNFPTQTQTVRSVGKEVISTDLVTTGKASLEKPMHNAVSRKPDSLMENSKVNSSSVLSDSIELPFQSITVKDTFSEKESPHDNTQMNDIVNAKINDLPGRSDRPSAKQLVNKFEAIGSHPEANIDPLTVITEEEEECAGIQFVRSISTCSDISSILSDNEAAMHTSLKAQKIPETVQKSNSRYFRSHSIETSRSRHTIPPKLLRSKSFHLDSPLTGQSQPWGEVCSGVISRAYQKFSQKSNEFSLVGRKSSDPTSDRPTLFPSKYN